MNKEPKPPITRRNYDISSTIEPPKRHLNTLLSSGSMGVGVKDQFDMIYRPDKTIFDRKKSKNEMNSIKRNFE